MPYQNIKPPRTQYNRNLTFTLKGGGSPVVYTMPIKPGEFERMHPARVTTTQTLQGVYQDFGGLGIMSLRIQGNTGWRRRTNGADNNGMDGYENFKMLYNKIYVEYHKRIIASKDPEAIKLLLLDDIYDVVYDISMDDFQASKSKSNPLLYNFTISMTVKSTNKNGRKAVDRTEILDSVLLDNNSIPIRLSEVLNTAGQYDPKTFRTYTVIKGDSLAGIAFMYFGTKDIAYQKKIAALNGIAPPYVFNPGIVLKIPW